MKNLICLGFIISVSWVNASTKNFPELNCDDSKIQIQRTNYLYGWGGIESFFLSSDFNVRGHILEERFNKGLIKGVFNIVENNWTTITPGQSITVDELVPSPAGKRILTLTFRRSPMIGCAKEVVVSGCYAGDDCITRCVQQVNIPEVIYNTKKVVCFERSYP